jgi:hypothetical protein
MKLMLTEDTFSVRIWMDPEAAPEDPPTVTVDVRDLCEGIQNLIRGKVSEVTL